VSAYDFKKYGELAKALDDLFSSHQTVHVKYAQLYLLRAGYSGNPYIAVSNYVYKNNGKKITKVKKAVYKKAEQLS
jgi:hypothetical protein